METVDTGLGLGKDFAPLNINTGGDVWTLEYVTQEEKQSEKTDWGIVFFTDSNGEEHSISNFGLASAKFPDSRTLKKVLNEAGITTLVIPNKLELASEFVETKNGYDVYNYFIENPVTDFLPKQTTIKGQGRPRSTPQK